VGAIKKKVKDWLGWGGSKGGKEKRKRHEGLRGGEETQSALGAGEKAVV